MHLYSTFVVFKRPLSTWDRPTPTISDQSEKSEKVRKGRKRSEKVGKGRKRSEKVGFLGQKMSEKVGKSRPQVLGGALIDAICNMWHVKDIGHTS